MRSRIIIAACATMMFGSIIASRFVQANTGPDCPPDPACGPSVSCTTKVAGARDQRCGGYVSNLGPAYICTGGGNKQYCWRPQIPGTDFVCVRSYECMWQFTTCVTTLNEIDSITAWPTSCN